jgi:hypothetical protein
LNDWDGPPDSQFDEELASGFVGKYLLVGVTHIAADGGVLSQDQLHGIIVAASAHGIDVELRGKNEGRTWRIPPLLDELSPARSGSYNLKATGEVVVDPDFLFTVTVRKPVRQ